MIICDTNGAVRATQVLTELELATNHKVDAYTTPCDAANLVSDFTETWVDTNTPEERRGLDLLLLALNTVGR